MNIKEKYKEIEDELRIKFPTLFTSETLDEVSDRLVAKQDEMDRVARLVHALESPGAKAVLGFLEQMYNELFEISKYGEKSDSCMATSVGKDGALAAMIAIDQIKGKLEESNIRLDKVTQEYNDLVNKKIAMQTKSA